MTNKEQIFDEILKKSLKQHCESIRDDFTELLLARIEKIEQQRAIKKVIFQERMSLAAFILLPLAILTVLIIFPAIIIWAGQLLMQVPSLIYQSLIVLTGQWKLLIYYVLIGFAGLYAFYQLTAKEN